MHYRPLILIILFFAFTAGCASQKTQNVNRGSSYQYKPGFPEVRFSAIGIIDQNDTPMIKLSADVVNKSLIFKKDGDSLAARILIEYRIQSLDDESEGITSKPQNITIYTRPNAKNGKAGLFNIERDIKVEPGNYKILLLVLDQNSLKQTASQAFASIPDIYDNERHLTNIRVLGKSLSDDLGEENFFTVNTYDINNRLDSLKFMFQVTNNRSEDPLIIRSRLLKFRSDTTIARPMNYNNYNQASIQYKGLDYSRSEVIQQTRRVINQPGSVVIEFIYPNLDRGNYRFEVESESNGDLELYKARDFGIKSQNYPNIASAYELAGPLRYLMNDKEYNKLISIQDSDSLKMAIDRFWLSNVKEPSIAKNVISLYYERVEEANKQFSSYKEGWKTDLGMVYILFGPPWYTDRTLNEVQWAYSYNRADINTNFFFVSPRLKNDSYPFDNYLLRRSFNYNSLLYRQVELWLTGQILRDNL